VEGFNFRIKGLLDSAEICFLTAWRISPKNQSINRELAGLYCKQRRYSEAESFARSAYLNAPTNPFIIDILVETLLGKISENLPVDKGEFNRLVQELKTYGDAPGSSFFLIREAQQMARSGNDVLGALKLLDRAIERTPALLPPYFIAADIQLTIGDVIGAERRFRKISELLTAAGGFSEGEEAQAQELEVRIMLEKRQFQAAKDRIERAAFLPTVVADRLLDSLARAIGFDPQGVDKALTDWAKGHVSGRPRQLRRRRR
jgi:tetratricopeptide (TPR) repeat protein